MFISRNVGLIIIKEIIRAKNKTGKRREGEKSKEANNASIADTNKGPVPPKKGNIIKGKRQPIDAPIRSKKYILFTSFDESVMTIDIIIPAMKKGIDKRI
jgi:hypothetical protein